VKQVVLVEGIVLQILIVLRAVKEIVVLKVQAFFLVVQTLLLVVEVVVVEVNFINSAISSFEKIEMTKALKR